MPTEIEWRDQASICEYLIDHRRKVYATSSYTPCITFWGFCNIFSGKHNIGIPFPGISMDSTEDRISFLEEIFKNTPVNPWEHIFKPRQVKKTRENILTKVWHLTWKYEKIPVSFECMLKQFKKDPEQTLDSIVRNLSTLIQRGQIDQVSAGVLAYQTLKSISESCLSGPKYPETERSLALLLLLCLLGDDVVLSDKYFEIIVEWLDRKRYPSGLLMVKSFYNKGIYHIQDTEINTKLLPDIICMEKRYGYRSDVGSPLRQIILEHHYQWLFLSGQISETEDSTGSGAGKTTSLRFLALEEKKLMYCGFH